MTVRDRTGRTRYIGFVVECTRRAGRDEFSRELDEMARRSGPGPRFQLTAFDGGRGILKVPHRLKDDFIRNLTSLRALGHDRAPLRVRTVVTSGTICTVKERMGMRSERPTPRQAQRPQNKGRGM